MSTAITDLAAPDVGLVSLVDAPSFTVTPTGLRIVGEPTFDEWHRVGDALCRVGGSLSWCVGDWIAHGEAAFGELASQAYALTGLSYGSLANALSICKRFPVSRRRETLSFGHHAAVAALSDVKADAALDHAERHALSVGSLRVYLRELRGARPDPWRVALDAALRALTRAAHADPTRAPLLDPILDALRALTRDAVSTEAAHVA